MPTSKTPQELSQQVKSDSNIPIERIPISEELKVIEAYERLKICQECDKYIKTARMCGVCKCFMPLKTKFKVSKCPLEKW